MCFIKLTNVCKDSFVHCFFLGEWCTFLAPGTYTAKVEVSEKEQREGLQ